MDKLAGQSEQDYQSRNFADTDFVKGLSKVTRLHFVTGCAMLLQLF